MKSLRFIFYILIAFAILCALMLSIIAFDKTDLKGSSNVLANSMTCIIACVSLIFSTIAISDTRSLHDKDYEREIFNRWYNNLIITPHFSQIQSFFSMCERQLIDEIVSLNQKRADLRGEEYDDLIRQTVVTPFTNSFTRLYQDLVTDISVIDSSLSEKISEEFMKFQDGYFDIINRPEINTEALFNCSKNSYRSIISILREYDISI